MSIELDHGPGYVIDPDIYISEVLIKLYGISLEDVCNFCGCCSNFVKLVNEKGEKVFAVGCYSNARHQKQLSIVESEYCDHACQLVVMDNGYQKYFEYGSVNKNGFIPNGTKSPRRRMIKMII